MKRSMSGRGLVAVLAAVAVALAGCAPGADAPDADPTGTAVTSVVAFDGTHVDAATFAKAMERDGVIVLDVRTAEEFAQGHLPGAINFDVGAPDFAERVAELNPAESYAVYCRSANRSRVAIDQMTEWGYRHTLGLEGGIVAWPGRVVGP